MTNRLMNQSVVSFRAGAKRGIQAALAESDGLETGGILVGPPHARDPILVTHVIGPGPNALRAYGRFERDTAWCQEQLSELQQMLPVEWIGDWHSHPESMVEPSLKDVSTAQALLDDAELGFDSYLMLIVCPHSTGPPWATAWVFSRVEGGRMKPTGLGPPEFQLLPGRIGRLTRPTLRDRYKLNHRPTNLVEQKGNGDV
jgi:integrative and conjugative element protein (TIGR02256 family)